jgi:cytochrome c biogenesis protein CcdA
MLTLFNLLLALLAGLLSVLSPCVLPLLPIVFASALNGRRSASWLLALGLALSFSVTGVVLVSLGWSMGFGSELLRTVNAWLLLLWGAVLLSSLLRDRLARFASPLADRAAACLAKISSETPWGPLLTGGLLGAVWLPCVGPTMGAVVVLAAEQSHRQEALLLTGVFGFGAALPLVWLGRLASLSARVRWLRFGARGRAVLGGMLVLVALAILSGFDKRIETVILDRMPTWLVALSVWI